jgi:hypothetical protein
MPSDLSLQSRQDGIHKHLGLDSKYAPAPSSPHSQEVENRAFNGSNERGKYQHECNACRLKVEDAS